MALPGKRARSAGASATRCARRDALRLALAHAKGAGRNHPIGPRGAAVRAFDLFGIFLHFEKQFVFRTAIFAFISIYRHNNSNISKKTKIRIFPRSGYSIFQVRRLSWKNPKTAG